MSRNLRRNKHGDFTYRPLSPRLQDRKKALLARPVEPLALTPTTSVAELVEAMAGMSIQARNIGQCAQVLQALYRDPDRPTVMLGLAGPLVAAGLRKVIRDLIAGGAIDVVVSTGAILYQDIYQARGFGHYRGTPQADDTQLRRLRIDRIYDTYVDEDRFWQTDSWVGHLADTLEPRNYSSRQFMDCIADQLDDEESIVVTCRRHGVPMFVPALNDSSIGIGLTEHRVRALRENRPGIAIDSIQDNHELVQIVVQSPKTAAIYVAGGVPKNYINDSVVMSYLYGMERGHDYAIQVTTAVTADGGLSGSTLSEAQSWGKIDEEARFAMAWVEPSVSLPLLAGYIFGKRLTAKRPPLRFEWEGTMLTALGPAPGGRKRSRRS
ncbi:MAG: deoxyhypusine synthase family protein [Candidatus Eisenbacteria sp.]|nr:deoxyhypusine synthase family protein [Candidatus Eisenbacteria bacterium]